MNSFRLMQLLTHTVAAHSLNAREDGQRFRRWDHATPHAVNPIWCGITMLHETALPDEIRLAAAEALILHDFDSNTEVPLPPDTSDQVRALIEQMRFDSLEVEVKEVWNRPPVVRLLRLYTTVATLMDCIWMSREQWSEYTAYACSLRFDVKREYGALLIVGFAENLPGRWRQLPSEYVSSERGGKTE